MRAARILLLNTGAPWLLASSLSAVSSPAVAQPRLHAQAGPAHAISTPQSRELSWGGSGQISAEWPWSRVFSGQLALGVAALAEGDAPSDPSLAKRGTGVLVAPMLGVRVQPWADGVWVGLNAGTGVTGPKLRPLLDAQVGYDVFVGRGNDFAAGPVIGYSQVVEPDDSLRPEDARMLSAGLHVTFGRRGPAPHAAASEDRARNGCPPVRASMPDLRADRDADTVFDDEDACADVPGPRTADPKTNGCPPPPDRDGDQIADREDACPDVPGLKSDDPRSHGCPPAVEEIRLLGDRIVLDDIIHFDVDSPRVKHVSWPLVNRVAKFINATPDITEIDVEGHADETGTEAYNLVLSQERAKTIRRLLTHFGVSADRIITLGYGESRPRAHGQRPEQLSENRRVEFIVVRAQHMGERP
jgi:OOP family OmpA-OmpF porin